jgi:hypothetical protein
MEVLQDAPTPPHDSPAPELTFERMDEMMDAYVADTKGSSSSTNERRALFAGVAGAGFALIATALSPEYLPRWWAVGGVALELGGFAAYLGFFLRREWRGLRNSRRDYAKELDQDCGKYTEYVQQLRNCSRGQRDYLLRYIQARRKVMHQRMGLVTGGMERLGILPLLAVLYVQFKDWRFGDWAAFGEVTFVQSLLALALLTIYLASWQLIRLYIRTESYELLLVEAAAQDEEVGFCQGSAPSHDAK